MMVALVLMLSATPPPGTTLEVRQNGTSKGYVRTEDFRGNVTVSVDAGVAYITIADGGTIGAGGAPADATYITKTCNASLSAEQCLSSNGTGIMISTTTTGVVSTYAGTSCTNQFARSLNASGAATCASVTLGTDTSGNYVATPGGNTNEVQYKTGTTTLGGIARVETDGTRLSIVSEPGNPAAPSADGTALHYDLQLDAGFPSMPFTIDNFMATPMPAALLGSTFQASAGANWQCGCTEAEGWGNNNFTSTRWVPGGQAVAGTSTSAVGWLSTSLYTRLHFIVQQSTGAINSPSEVRHQRQTVWRGNAAGAGGWISQHRFGLDVIDGGARVAVGLWNATTAPTATTDPSTIVNSVYVGCDATQSTMRVCSNDNSGSATCTDLGSNFPCAGTSGGGAAAGVNQVPYDFWLTAAPNASAINYYLKRLDTGTEISGAITTDLPQNTVQMGWHTYANTGTSNTPVRIAFMYVCNCANL